ncbi:unnamed protein product [Lactuca saligna]|uniref:Uncharacterized protein n=1 Tax=Lactuca saligna TaxID=75948 RepID=A0AA35YB46_LACSI|nr:unnamed protein product [Lactuca saligna]
MGGREGIRWNSTLICAPIMADTVDQILIQMNSAKSYGVDLVDICLQVPGIKMNTGATGGEFAAEAGTYIMEGIEIVIEVGPAVGVGALIIIEHTGGVEMMRLQKCLQAYGFDVIGQIMVDVSHLCQIFRTPEEMLSIEHGIYIAESVASNNLKQAIGRFKTYENNDNMENGNSNFGRRDTGGKEGSAVGKKDAGKPTKKSGKPQASTLTSNDTLPHIPSIQFETE